MKRIAILAACLGISLNAIAAPPGKTFKDCEHCPEMVVIPAGSFAMGSQGGDSEEGPLHTVSFRKPFALGKTEITQGQWSAVLGWFPVNFTHCGKDCAMENVSWHDAQNFVRALSAKTGKAYRLPSEAEWEYACRAGERHEYCGSDKLDAVAWYGANSKPVGNSGKTTHPVARKQANAWGLFDMSGNVWEWTQDCWNDDYSGAPGDGSARETGDCTLRVLRGGSWSVDPRVVRAASRGRGNPTSHGRSAGSGFRVALSLP
jgi:formylglycine-generating enzyme required for sulfatase activity